MECSFIASFISGLILTTTVVSGLRCWECENVYSQEECLARGRMVECEPTQNTCQITLRHGGWGERPLIEKNCKQLAACGSNHVQDSKSASVFFSDTQCNMKAPSSVCRCCCSTDGCNHEVLFCEGYQPGGRLCTQQERPRWGYMKCEGERNPESSCEFGCRKGYSLVGAPVTHCNLFSEWDYPAPRCRPVICHALREQRFGAYTCTNGRQHRSRCSFTCQAGYRLRGARELVCTEDDREGKTFGLWSRPQPICSPLKCPSQSIENGRVTCTNRFFVASSCTFQCNDGFQLITTNGDSNICQSNEEWNRTPPCCKLPCPPNAVMDFVVVLDSSSSVGRDNFEKMKSFVRSFLSDFTVSDSATHFSVIRYNRAVDRSTQILLNQYPNSLADVLAAFDRIPYDGSGTRTGNALNYTASTLLRIGNRPEARDVVLLITDGRSQDDVRIPSRNLHATNPLVFVLPVRPPRGALDLRQIEIIAQRPENILRDALDRGFDALDDAFAARISRILCQGQCG